MISSSGPSRYDLWKFTAPGPCENVCTVRPEALLLRDTEAELKLLFESSLPVELTALSDRVGWLCFMLGIQWLGLPALRFKGGGGGCDSTAKKCAMISLLYRYTSCIRKIPRIRFSESGAVCGICWVESRFTAKVTSKKVDARRKPKALHAERRLPISL